MHVFFNDKSLLKSNPINKIKIYENVKRRAILSPVMNTERNNIVEIIKSKF